MNSQHRGESRGEPDINPDINPDSRWQFSLRELLSWTAIVAVGCGLLVWLGGPLMCALVGAAVGAFLAALLSPWLGLEYVLDHLRSDQLRCVAVAAYLVLGTWGLVALIGWLAAEVHGDGAPTFVSASVLALHLYLTGILVKTLWQGISQLEAMLVALGALVGTGFALLVWNSL